MKGNKPHKKAYVVGGLILNQIDGDNLHNTFASNLNKNLEDLEKKRKYINNRVLSGIAKMKENRIETLYLSEPDYYGEKLIIGEDNIETPKIPSKFTNYVNLLKHHIAPKIGIEVSFENACEPLVNYIQNDAEKKGYRTIGVIIGTTLADSVNNVLNSKGFESEVITKVRMPKLTEYMNEDALAKYAKKYDQWYLSNLVKLLRTF